ncbi:MAG: alpha/beta hydrolase [Saprospiraceae bacterium]|nr:alpha/beta hydrolase [Saprospiraceae bacterium]
MKPVIMTPEEGIKQYFKSHFKHSIKTYFYSFILLISSFSAIAQENKPFTIGFEKSFISKILNQERKIWIHIPNSNGGNTGNEPYPVIYLLDGDENFNDIVSITEFMSKTGLCPPMIVVGILHPSRMTDLTFGTDKETPGIVGKGEKFMLYVEKELMPYIESNYPTASYKIFIGHSVGGLTVVNTLMYHPELFNAYVSLDGALWWNNQHIVTEAKMILTNKNYSGKTLYMALANRMERGMDTLLVQKDTTEGTELIRSNLEFIKDIFKNKTNQLQFQHKYYENDDHSSVRLIGEYDALRFIFDYYKLKIYNSELEDPNFKLDSLFITHYHQVSERIGFLIKPDENQVNGLGYYMMSQKQFIKAEALFKLNIANYPETANCYDGLGDLYLAKGEPLNAIESFKKTLSLKFIPETKLKLEKLLNEKK